MLQRNLTVRNRPREMPYMYKPLTVTAIYPFDKNPTREEWEDYDYMMRRAGSSNKYTLVQEGPYDYYVYFAADDTRFPDYLIGKLDGESVQKLLHKCPANRYEVSWRQNYYGDFILQDGSRRLDGRAGGIFTLEVSHWVCPHCGQMLLDKDASCKYCGKPRPGAIVPPEESMPDKKADSVTGDLYVPSYSPWVCQVCGTRNETHNYCGECGARKGTNRLTAPSR